jgi:hypothetical protein
MRAQRNYTLKSCEKLICKYLNDYEGNIIQINEGCLGLGTILLYGAEGKKSILINEVFVNAWTSTHTIKMYNKLPKKYLKLIDSIQ